MITAIVGPKRAPVTFLIDTGAQISALTEEDARRCGVIPSKQNVCVLNALGSTEVMNVAPVRLMLPGEESTVTIYMVVGNIPTNLLGIDALKGRGWEDSEGLLWTFGTPQLNIRLLQTAPPLPLSKITNVKQYPLPPGSKGRYQTSHAGDAGTRSGDKYPFSF